VNRSKWLPQPTALLKDAMRQLEAAIDGPYLCGAEVCYADVPLSADELRATSRRSSRIRTQASIFAILNEVLNYSVFDRAALLADHPKLSRLMEEMSAKEAAWIAHRVATHQCGIADTISFFAATNTPFPWSKVAKGPSVVQYYPAAE